MIVFFSFLALLRPLYSSGHDGGKSLCPAGCAAALADQANRDSLCGDNEDPPPSPCTTMDFFSCFSELMAVCGATGECPAGCAAALTDPVNRDSLCGDNEDPMPTPCTEIYFLNCMSEMMAACEDTGVISYNKRYGDSKGDRGSGTGFSQDPYSMEISSGKCPFVCIPGSDVCDRFEAEIKSLNSNESPSRENVVEAGTDSSGSVCKTGYFECPESRISYCNCGLFFSQYGGDSGFNKYLEIYNPTDSDINLSMYTLLWSDINDLIPTYNDFSKHDIIESHGVFVIADPDLDASDDIREKVDKFVEMNHNGNYAIVLLRREDDQPIFLDSIGKYDSKDWEIIDNGWDVAGVESATKDRTLIRKSHISHGNRNDWKDSAGTNEDDSEWIVKDRDEITDLGNHGYMGCCDMERKKEQCFEATIRESGLHDSDEDPDFDTGVISGCYIWETEFAMNVWMLCHGQGYNKNKKFDFNCSELDRRDICDNGEQQLTCEQIAIHRNYWYEDVGDNALNNWKEQCCRKGPEDDLKHPVVITVGSTGFSSYTKEVDDSIPYGGLEDCKAHVSDIPNDNDNKVRNLTIIAGSCFCLACVVFIGAYLYIKKLKREVDRCTAKDDLEKRIPEKLKPQKSVAGLLGNYAEVPMSFSNSEGGGKELYSDVPIFIDLKDGEAEEVEGEVATKNVSAGDTLPPVSLTPRSLALSKKKSWSNQNKAERASSLVSSAEKQIKSSDLTFIEKIGKGAFGEVWKGKWRGSEVAIKRGENTEAAIEDMKEEADSWLEISDHPNILRFMGICLGEKEICLVCEYIRDGCVLDRLHDTGFSQNQKYDIAKQAAAGVYSLHCDHIVHRDLALRNLLIDLSQFRVVVSDFGLSRIQDYHNNAAKTNTRNLPIAWSAPESLKDSIYSQATDVWAFGVLLWELFSEDIPYENVHVFKRMSGIVDGSLELKMGDDWDDEIKDTMQMCWKRKPAERPGMNEIMNTFESMLQKDVMRDQLQ